MQFKSDKEVLAEIYRNTQLALQSISDIMPEIEDDDIKKEIAYQHDEYERISGRACAIARDTGSELKEPSAIKKAMMWSAIKMNTVNDSGSQHIAALMLRGTVMGLASLKTTYTDTEKTLSNDIKHLLKDLIALEENFEKRLKSYL